MTVDPMDLCKGILEAHNTALDYNRSSAFIQEKMTEDFFAYVSSVLEQLIINQVSHGLKVYTEGFRGGARGHDYVRTYTIPLKIIEQILSDGIFVPYNRGTAGTIVVFKKRRLNDVIELVSANNIQSELRKLQPCIDTEVVIHNRLFGNLLKVVCIFDADN